MDQNNIILLESVNIGLLVIQARVPMRKNANIHREEIHMKK